MLLRTERYSNLSEKKLFIPIFYDNNPTGQNAKFQSKEVFDSNTQQYYMRKKIMAQSSIHVLQKGPF